MEAQLEAEKIRHVEEIAAIRAEFDLIKAELTSKLDDAKAEVWYYYHIIDIWCYVCTEHTESIRLTVFNLNKLNSYIGKYLLICMTESIILAKNAIVNNMNYKW